MKTSIITVGLVGILTTLFAPAQTIDSVEYSNLEVTLDRVISTPVVKIQFTVSNPGETELNETPCVYYQCPKCPIYRPLGKCKTVKLPPGGSANISVLPKQYDIAQFTKGSDQRTISKGLHRFVVRSSQNINRLQSDFPIENEIVFQFKKGFSGPVYTEWQGPRNMRLDHNLVFTDRTGKRWKAPRGSFVNGATIPQYLWSVIGSPFVGNYRRASAIHDYFVGEDQNPNPISPEAIKAADRMFFEACVSDGCSIEFASTLYIGVRYGSWKRSKRRSLHANTGTLRIQIDQQIIQDDIDRNRFLATIIKKLQPAIKKGDLDQIDAAFK